MDEKRALKLCNSLEVNVVRFKKFVIDYFNSDEKTILKKDPQPGSIRKSPAEVEVSKGELRKSTFVEFPILLDFLVRDIFDSKTDTTCLPQYLQEVIDSGMASKGLENYYKISPNALRKIPFSIKTNISSGAIVQMIRHGVLKPEWFPGLKKGVNMQSLSVEERDPVYQKLQNEQDAFYKVIIGCFILSKHLKFNVDVNDPSTYPPFLVELIKKTAEASSKSWQTTASALPPELLSSKVGHSNIRDAVNDFIKTIFLPYLIRNNLEEYISGSADKLLDENRLKITEAFLKGVSLSAVCDLSSRWHEIGVTAQLNKAKTFLNHAWEPLFASPITYDSITAVPLTTSAELTKEGKDLNHCVGGYTNQCLTGHSHIVSFRDETGKSLSTLELQLHPNNGDPEDPTIINIKGENQYHLELVQHHGKRNEPPLAQCKETEKKLFEDIRTGKLKVDLSGLEQKLEERKIIIKEKKDIVLIGYDPTDRESFEKAKAIYRDNGIGNISFRNTFISNFNALTGEKQEKSVGESSVSKRRRINIENPIVSIQESLNVLFEEGEVEVGLEETDQNPHGKVTITLAEGNKHSLEMLREKLDVIFGIDNISYSSEGCLEINKTPKYVSQKLRGEINKKATVE